MFIKITGLQADYLKTGMIFWPVLAYIPFFFTQWVNPALRIGCFATLSLYLFFSSKRYSKNDAYIFILLLFLATLLVVGNSSGLEGLMSVGNYCLTILFGWGLYRHLTLRRARTPVLLGLYVKFFYFVTICSVLSMFYFFTLGEFDLFGFKSDVYQHLVTPFGILFKREVGPITLYRSFFYFVEPVYVAIFYAANIVIIAPLLKGKGETVAFRNVNSLGGVLSLSMTFVVVLAVLYALRKVTSLYTFISVSFGAVILTYALAIIEVLLYSSFNDRAERYFLFYTAMSEANIMQTLFGHGVTYVTGFEKAFNSGFTLSIYETGIIGLILQLTILCRINSGFNSLMLFMLAASVVDPIHMPLFWVLFVIISHAEKNAAADSKDAYVRSPVG